MARSTAEVITITHEFLASWVPLDVAVLPAGCWPGRIAQAEDITAHAVDLLGARIDRAEDEATLKLITMFFVAASNRLVQLASNVSVRQAGERV